MLKSLLLLIAIVAATTVSACTRNNLQYTETETSYRVSFGSTVGAVYVNVWVDPETGCEHYVTDDGFMQPRLNADGMQRCRLLPPSPAAPAI